MVGAGQRLIEREVAGAEHIEELEEEFIDAHGDHGQATAIQIGFDGEGEFLKADAEFRGSFPDGLIGVAEDVGEFVEVGFTEDEPGGPLPFLIGPANADIQNEEVETAGTDIGVADAMKFPGAIDGEVVGLEGVLDAFGGEIENAIFEEGELEAFVAVPGQAPILVLLGIPVADGLEAAQGTLRELSSRVLAAGEGFVAEVTSSDGFDQGGASVRFVHLTPSAVDGRRSRHSGNFITVRNLDPRENVQKTSPRE